MLVNQCNNNSSHQENMIKFRQRIFLLGQIIIEKQKEKTTDLIEEFIQQNEL